MNVSAISRTMSMLCGWWTPTDLAVRYQRAAIRSVFGEAQNCLVAVCLSIKRRKKNGCARR